MKRGPSTVAQLERELKTVRRTLTDLAEVFYTHARTDLAPDACLPKLRKLIWKLRQGAR